jgi:hypothetical protein
MTAKPSPFIWYDLMTPDLRASEDFYSRVVGWKIADSGMPGISYSILSAGDTMVGGMMGMVEGGPPPMWTGYIHSSDVDADAKRAAALGGKVCKPAEDIPEVGRFAVIADPGGAMFNLFRPNSTEELKKVPRGTPGHISWHDLRARDGGKAWNFYSQMFHWTKSDALEMEPGAVYQMFATGGEAIGGMMTMRPETPFPHWQFFFAVDAIDAAAERVRSAGGTIIMEPMEVPGGEWIIEVRDPHGATFGLVASRR